MIGKYDIELYNNKVHYFLTVKRNITMLQGNSATGKTYEAESDKATRERYKDRIKEIDKELKTEKDEKRISEMKKQKEDLTNSINEINKKYENKDIKSDKEYDLYKQAQENPDSIDPMTENSTDWGALDKKYSDRYKKEYIKVKRYPDDPNNNEYISVKRDLDNEYPSKAFRTEEKEKVPRASGSKDFSEYGIDIREQDTKERFSDYLRDKYGTDDFRIISYDDKKKAQEIYHNWNKEQLKAYQDKWLNSDEYLAKNNPGMYLTKLEKEAGVRTFADDIALKNRYKGTYDYLKNTKGMNGADILEMLKKIDEDRK